uniref:Uncharacterized protein n=1 Tax=Oryza meridionalis TaxID=40149 RepID=A0A0E0E046_9ORYZ
MYSCIVNRATAITFPIHLLPRLLPSLLPSPCVVNGGGGRARDDDAVLAYSRPHCADRMYMSAACLATLLMRLVLRHVGRMPPSPSQRPLYFARSARARRRRAARPPPACARGRWQ